VPPGPTDQREPSPQNRRVHRESMGLAALVALDDFDFFSTADFADTTAPHHKHIFVALVLVGFAFVETRFVPTWDPQGELNPRRALRGREDTQDRSWTLRLVLI